ncbi:hypothetical protein CMI48_02115 [Candidatus Pacearchaeota archaeon]|nr:hypothetical protein [Candidatus Pacearchaeota archaeon]
MQNKFVKPLFFINVVFFLILFAVSLGILRFSDFLALSFLFLSIFGFFGFPLLVLISGILLWKVKKTGADGLGLSAFSFLLSLINAVFNYILLTGILGKNMWS